MSDKEVLEAAITKAIEGGWVMKYHNSTLWNVRELSAVIASDSALTLLSRLYFPMSSVGHCGKIQS